MHFLFLYNAPRTCVGVPGGAVCEGAVLHVLRALLPDSVHVEEVHLNGVCCVCGDGVCFCVMCACVLVYLWSVCMHVSLVCVLCVYV